MGVYYTNERARYGGVSGTIIPFPIKMPDTNVPDIGDWRDILPAGYLRCDGSILSATEYPVLAQVLGTGQNSKFRRPDLTLSSNQFQLPDLGSKNIIGCDVNCCLQPCSIDFCILKRIIQLISSRYFRSTRKIN